MLVFKKWWRFFSTSKNRRLSEFLGFQPNDITLYERAFVHRSVHPEPGKNNERLEFLGDAVLDTVITHFLFEHYPDRTEGFLTKMRAKIVSRKGLNQLAREIGIKHYISTSQSVQQHQTSLYGNALEALVGAMYLDKGYSFTQQYIVTHWLERYIDLDYLIAYEVDFKSKVLEWAQREKKIILFEIESLPQREDGSYQFKATLFLEDQPMFNAIATSKKRSEQAVAQVFYQQIINK